LQTTSIPQQFRDELREELDRTMRMVGQAKTIGFRGSYTQDFKNANDHLHDIIPAGYDTERIDMQRSVALIEQLRHIRFLIDVHVGVTDGDGFSLWVQSSGSFAKSDKV